MSGCTNAWSVAGARRVAAWPSTTPAYPVRLRDDGERDWSFVSDVYGSREQSPGRGRQRSSSHRGWRTRIACASGGSTPTARWIRLFGAREFAVGEIVSIGAGERRRDAGRVGRPMATCSVRRLLGGGAIPPARAVLRDFSLTTVRGGRRRGASGAGHVRSRAGVAAGRHVPADTSAARPGVGEDYRLAADVVTIPAGQTRATVPVTILGDTADEGDESTAPHRGRGARRTCGCWRTAERRR